MFNQLLYFGKGHEAGYIWLAVTLACFVTMVLSVCLLAFFFKALFIAIKRLICNQKSKQALLT